MNHFCPACWERNDWGKETCTTCGAPLRGSEEETYAQKLVWALDHPEASSALRAATILGKLGNKEATEPLIEVLKTPGKDPYRAAAAARSLGTLGDPWARKALVEALEHGPIVVRVAAAEALGALGPDGEATGALRRASETKSPNLSDAAVRVLNEWARMELSW